MSKPRFSPRAFLKGRRPEKFSDTVKATEPVLDRSHLEYHLDKLTSRSQEKAFELFSRHLIQKVVCPNLLPQTGPTGGGDSKVDSETYPVSDALSFAWHVGIGREAASERWAFAFSAMKKWKPKIDSDVSKLVATNRGYKKAFFTTNQYVRDKERAKIEDDLNKKHGVDVRIFDLTWILDHVFDGGHEALAIEHLGVQTSARVAVRKGPQDVRREQDLDEIEKRISDAAGRGAFGLSFVEDCMEASILSAELDRPKVEVDGYFVRAKRAASTYGSRHHQLVCEYNQSWTAYFWHEDYPTFLQHYKEVELLAAGTRNVYDLELLSNLWFNLFSATKRSDIDASDVGFADRTSRLLGELERLASEVDRPSTSLQSQSIGLMVRLAMAESNEAAAIFREIQAVALQARMLVGFPWDSLMGMIAEVGQKFGDLTEYQELFEVFIEASSERQKDLAAARMLIVRGSQLLESDRQTEAIRTMGRALARLYKNESRHELIRGLNLCSLSYESLGLLWAARGTCLNAASLATNDYWSYETVTIQQAACYKRLKWLELFLGRLPQALAWHEIDLAVRHNLSEKGYNPSYHPKSEMDFDAALGSLLLRVDCWDLSRISRLPETLDKLGLFNSSLALRYSLGHMEGVSEDLKNSGFVEDEIHEHFRRLRDVPFEVEVVGLSLYDQMSIELRSAILGCKIVAQVENDSGCIFLAESILAALESILSTGVVDRIISREPSLLITVKRSGLTEIPFDYSVVSQFKG